MGHLRVKHPRFNLSLLFMLVMAAAAFSTRLLPLSISQYPFNNDSLMECEMASEIVKTGHLSFSHESLLSQTHTAAMPIHNVVLAFIAQSLGVAPWQCAQFYGAVLAITTVCGLFLLGRLFSGSLAGGVAAGLSGAIMGTFVFTTGSLWKETLGISLLVLAIFSYVRRSGIEFRILTFLLLTVMPFVHHLVAAVAFLLFSYLLAWSWFFAISTHAPKKRYISDTVMIAVPIAVGGAYYLNVGLDNATSVISGIGILLIISGFCLLSLIASVVLSMRSHSKWTYAPAVGAVLLTVIIMDFFGLVFPYSPSASNYYLLLAIAFAFLVSLCWYGTELVLETRPLHRAVQLALFLSPVTIIGYGMIHGHSFEFQKIVYRSFDFFDFFIFLGIAVGVTELAARRRRFGPIVALLMVIALLISFPFGYYSAQLLGVRHDTQGYELDSIEWLANHAESPIVVATDERMAYITQATIDAHADPGLPQYLIDPQLFPNFLYYYVLEDSWTTLGVNNFPHGKLVLSQATYEQRLKASDVFYVGGPSNDRVVVFLASEMGSRSVYGNR